MAVSVYSICMYLAYLCVYVSAWIYVSMYKNKMYLQSLICVLKRKKMFPFVSLRSENNLNEAKRKMGSEKIELIFLKVHKIENLFGSECEFYTISLLVMLKY